jgi:hypothetical protein
MLCGVLEITVKGRTPRKARETFVPPSEPPPTAVAASKRRSRARQNGVDEPVPSVADAPDEVPEDVVALSDDLAATVVKKTLRRMATGELQPSLRDGLIAQQLLDRREEKAADRQFMLSLARAMAGGGYQAPQHLLPAPSEPPEEAIEGYFEEVPLAPEHLRRD